MRFLYLFLIFLFFHLQANGMCINKEVDIICEKVCGESCTGATNEVPADQAKLGLNNKPGDQQSYTREGDSAPLTKTPDGTFLAADYYFPGAGAPIELPKDIAGCDSGHAQAQTCCNDPVSCLGGEHLSTFNQVNNIATQVGPGMSMLLQGTGKDMSGMCEALQAMAGAGAGLSTAALTKCKGSISTCRTACDSDIQKNCQEYSTRKAKCEAAANSRPQGPDFTNFQKNTEPFVTKILKAENTTKPACSALNAKAGEIASNLGQMANSAISAELCKQQASSSKTKEECAKANGKWDGYRCITQEGECEKQDGIWDGKKCKTQQQVCAEKGSDWRWNNVECVHRMTECEEAQQKGVAVVWDPQASLGKGECRAVAPTTVNNGDGGGDLKDQYGNGVNLNTETPGTGSDENEYDPDNPDNNNVGGGGGGSTLGISGSTSPGSSGLLSGLKSSSGTSPTTDSSSTPAATAGKSSYRGARMGGFGRGFSRRRSRERTPGSSNDDDKPGLSMGGGGFSGYGGGGSGDDDSYASLGLSKKKLKELKKKAGAKRKAASEGLGGAHQNIFERITKRFQSLCKNKLDCR